MSRKLDVVALSGDEYDELVANANRYLHLRNSAHFGGNESYDMRWFLPRRYDGTDLREQLDDAIDRAIENHLQKS